ncbi:hypothetical protein H310_11122 [Aphanomyces invadans]|uniref:Uncharacterized protein n=1 Tax=Aphanomyces invadans TaxID=157072 RepID=A0A024TQ01_9STRA|nr:hypothetical protein H310_11122 [Aphanomyces invadans]ETV95706.1 hypothetical protein H310_11122 [Aphanomyces invadans]|eukprot:XP_008875899.1 hypothetical protein H310_11122 [Aphanomyces invadans]
MLVAHSSLDVNKLDQDGFSALAHACFEEFEDIVLLLLKHSAIQPLAGTKSAFTRSVEKGHSGILDHLLAHTPLPSSVLPSGELPLAVMACQRGHLDVVKLLLTKGLFQNDPPDIQRQAVYQALANKRIKLSRFLLLDNFAKLTLARTPPGERTLLHAAAAIGNEAMVAALVGHRVDDVAALDSNHESALHVAAKASNWEVAIRLLSADLPIEIVHGQVVPKSSPGHSWTAFADPSGPFAMVDESTRCAVVRAIVLQFPESKQTDVAQALLAAIHPTSNQSVGTYIDPASLNLLTLWATSTPVAAADGSDGEEDLAGGGDDHANKTSIDAASTLNFSKPSRPPGVSSDAGSSDRSSARLRKSIMLQPMQHLNSSVSANEMFYLACQSGDINMVRSQLPLASSGKLDLNRFTHHQDTPLCVACVEERLDIVALLLSQPSIQVNLCNYSHPPLTLAAGLGRVEVVELLLSHPSIDVNVATARRTPLTAACENGHLAVVRLLCARPDLKLNLLDHDGHSALFSACLHGNTDVVRFLLTLPDLDVNLLCCGDLALTIATVYHHTDIVDMLLAIPSLDVNHLDQDGLSALAHACHEGFDDIVSTLLKHPAIQLRTGTKSAFTRAVEKGHGAVLDRLIAHEPLTSTVQSPTELALATVACQRGHLGIVKLFVTRGIFQSDPPDVQRMSLYEAVANKRLKVARLLLDTTGIAWAPTPKGQSTLLHAAALGGSETLVAALLARNIETIGALDTEDRTALQLAVHEGNWGAATLLLGADLPVEVAIDGHVVPRVSYDHSWTDFADPCGVYSVVNESTRCDVVRALMLQFPEDKQVDVAQGLLATMIAATGCSVASYIDKKCLNLLSTWAPSPPLTDPSACESRRTLRTPGAVSIDRIQTTDAMGT